MASSISAMKLHLPGGGRDIRTLVSIAWMRGAYRRPTRLTLEQRETIYTRNGVTS